MCNDLKSMNEKFDLLRYIKEIEKKCVGKGLPRLEEVQEFMDSMNMDKKKGGKNLLSTK